MVSLQIFKKYGFPLTAKKWLLYFNLLWNGEVIDLISIELHNNMISENKKDSLMFAKILFL